MPRGSDGQGTVHRSNAAEDFARCKGLGWKGLERIAVTGECVKAGKIPIASLAQEESFVAQGFEDKPDFFCCAAQHLGQGKGAFRFMNAHHPVAVLRLACGQAEQEIACVPRGAVVARVAGLFHRTGAVKGDGFGIGGCGVRRCMYGLPQRLARDAAEAA